MTLRTLKERAAHALAYEIGGLVLVTPVFSFFSQYGTSDSVLLLVVLSAIVLAWAPIHNGVFDLLEWKLAGRVASDRTMNLRFLHALSLETTVLFLTCPAIILLAGVSLSTALLTNFGLTVAYAVYAFFFHMVADRVRPVIRWP